MTPSTPDEPAGAGGTSGSPRDCPSAYQLEAFLFEGQPADHPLTDHLPECPGCQRRLVEAKHQALQFEEEALPATLASVLAQLAAASRPKIAGRGFRVWLFSPVGLTAATVAAAILLVVGLVVWSGIPGIRGFQGLAGDSDDGYRGIKGTIGVEVVCQRGEEIFRVEDGTVLLPGDRLRFNLSVPNPGYVAVVAIDANNRVSTFFPDTGNQALPWIPGAGPLPGSIALDESRGEERLFVLFSKNPFELASVHSAVEQALSTGHNPVTLVRLPLALDQVSLRVIKGRIP